MQGYTIFVAAFLTLVSGIDGCTMKETFSCKQQVTTKDSTVEWCWKFWYLFRCQEEKDEVRDMMSTCSRDACCPGYEWSNSWHSHCKPVCFGGLGCKNGGTCIAPNVCECFPGFKGPKCEDRDECAFKNGGCSHRCITDRGSYHCECPSGYSLDDYGRTCKAVCFGEMRCMNGGTCFAPNVCACTTGFTGPKCEDLDECVSKNGGCSHLCSNDRGSYHCECPSGYSLDDNGLTCKVKDECAIENGDCSHTCIISVLGMKVCECPSGLTLSSNQRDCEGPNCDIIGCSHTCNVINGSSTCTCPPNMELADDDKTCTGTWEEVHIHHHSYGSPFTCRAMVTVIIFLVGCLIILVRKRYPAAWNKHVPEFKRPAFTKDLRLPTCSKHVSCWPNRYIRLPTYDEAVLCTVEEGFAVDGSVDANTDSKLGGKGYI